MLQTDENQDQSDFDANGGNNAPTDLFMLKALQEQLQEEDQSDKNSQINFQPQLNKNRSGFNFQGRIRTDSFANLQGDASIGALQKANQEDVADQSGAGDENGSIFNFWEEAQSIIFRKRQKRFT